MLSLFAFFGIVLFAFPQYKKYRNEKLKIYFWAIILLLIMLMRPTPLAGKWYLAIAFTIFAVAYNAAPLKAAIGFAGIAILLYLVFFTTVFDPLLQGNQYMYLKYQEAKQLVTFASVANVTRMEDSSSLFRIDELVNICMEYINKPMYLVFGKGLVGSITHHTFTISWAGVGSFSAAQQQAGVYIRMHESINLIFLKYGLIGVVGLTKLLLILFKCIKRSPWAIIGFLWILFYVGVYQTMLFGAVAMCLGIYEGYSTIQGE